MQRQPRRVMGVVSCAEYPGQEEEAGGAAEPGLERRGAARPAYRTRPGARLGVALSGAAGLG